MTPKFKADSKEQTRNPATESECMVNVNQAEGPRNIPCNAKEQE